MVHVKDKLRMCEQVTVRVHHVDKGSTDAAPRCSWPGCNDKVVFYIGDAYYCSAHAELTVQREMRNEDAK